VSRVFILARFQYRRLPERGVVCAQSSTTFPSAWRWGPTRRHPTRARTRRRIVHLRTDNLPEDIRTSRRSPMATQHQTDQDAGIPAEDHKQSHPPVRLRCNVDLVSRTSERRFEETNDSLPGSLPWSPSSSHGHAPCLADAVWLYTPPTCACLT
jgi:hypothetical protein